MLQNIANLTFIIALGIYYQYLTALHDTCTESMMKSSTNFIYFLL